MAGLITKRKLEAELEIREGASHVFHDLFANRPHDLNKVDDGFIQNCDLHEGDCGALDSIMEWNYILDGEAQTIKSKIKVVDEENKLMKFDIIGGDMTKNYKNIVTSFQVFPKDEETSIVRWTFEYEKLDAGFREPTVELDALVKLAKDIDDHHHAQN